jgi:hypothetical protein
LLDKNWRTRADAQSILEKDEMQLYIKKVISFVSEFDKKAA